MRFVRGTSVGASDTARSLSYPVLLAHIWQRRLVRATSIHWRLTGIKKYVVADADSTKACRYCFDQYSSNELTGQFATGTSCEWSDFEGIQHCVSINAVAVCQVASRRPSHRPASSLQRSIFWQALHFLTLPRMRPPLRGRVHFLWSRCVTTCTR